MYQKSIYSTKLLLEELWEIFILKLFCIFQIPSKTDYFYHQKKKVFFLRFYLRESEQAESRSGVGGRQRRSRLPTEQGAQRGA